MPRWSPQGCHHRSWTDVRLGAIPTLMFPVCAFESRIRVNEEGTATNSSDGPLIRGRFASVRLLSRKRSFAEAVL